MNKLTPKNVDTRLSVMQDSLPGLEYWSLEYCDSWSVQFSETQINLYSYFQDHVSLARKVFSIEIYNTAMPQDDLGIADTK